VTRREFLTLAVSGISAACVSGTFESALSQTTRIPMRDVIIVIPGILGSTLYASNRAAWAPSLGAINDMLLGLWRHKERLQLSNDPVDTDDLGDGVEARALMPDLHLAPGLWKVDGYSQLRRDLLANFEIQLGLNYFEFPYDWRRDNRVSARRLEKCVDTWLNKWRLHSGNRTAKVIFVCHSMGGLIALYYLEVLGGWRKTKSLITFGTPFSGSMKALNFVANGYEQDFPLVGTIELSAVSSLLRSFTSVYQLLPTYPCCYNNNTLVSIDRLSGIPNLDQRKLNNAITFHAEIAAAQAANIALPEYTQSKYTLCNVIGINEPTLVTGSLDRSGFKTSTVTGVFGGDGTVPRLSAKSNDASLVYVTEFHGSLQNSERVFEQLEGFVTEERTREALPLEEIHLFLADAYPAGKPIEARVSTEQSPSKSRIYIGISKSKDPSKRPVRTRELRPNRGMSFDVTFDALPIGSYRVVAWTNTGQSVADVIAVL
jgi:hypothetical protein